MATFANQSKSSASFANQSKNSATFANQNNLGVLSYLVTDAPDFVLVGSAEADTLILWGDTAYTNLTKN